MGRKINILLALLLCLQTWFAYVVFDHTYLGINIRESNDAWRIAYFDSSASGMKLGFQVGDKIVSINGENPLQHYSVMKFSIIENAHSIEIERESGIQTIPIENNHRLDGMDITSLLGELFSFLIAFLLYKLIKDSKSAKYLSLIFALIGLTFMTLGATARGDITAKIVVGFAIMTLPIIFLHFLFVFLHEKGDLLLPKRYFKYFYGFIIIYNFSRLVFFLPAVTREFYILDHRFEMLFFSTAFVMNIIFLLFVYFRNRQEFTYVSTIIRMIGVSFVISLTPLAVFTFLPEVIFHRQLVPSLVSGWFVFLFPATLAYIIVSKQIFDIQIVFRRALMSTMISTFPSAAIAVFVRLLDQSLPWPEVVLVGVFSVILFSVILYSLEYLIRRLSVVIFPKKHALQTTLKNVSDRIATIRSFRELRDTILIDVVRSLELQGAAIVLQSGGQLDTVHFGKIDQAVIEKELLTEPPPNSRYLYRLISREDEDSSYLVLTDKRANTQLSQEEEHWLNLILSYLTVAVQNVTLIRKLTMKLHELAAQMPEEASANDIAWFRKSMFDMQEMERHRIATDLHDSTMQDILYVKRELETMVHMPEPKPENRLKRLMRHLEVINENLRQSCFELNPYLLQRVGLVETIERTVELEQGLCEFEIVFLADRDREEIERLDLETKRHLFRVFQEILHNAKKHSQASHILIRLLVHSGAVILSYKDDGIGFDVARLKLSPNRISLSGLGLEQMRSRIRHLNGQFDIETEQGAGVKITVRVPMKIAG